MSVTELDVRLPREVRRIHQIEMTSHCNLRCVYCCAEEQLVPTEGGMLRADRIAPGMIVFGNDGKRRQVTRVTPHQESEPTVKIKPNNLPPIHVSGDHGILTQRGMIPAREVTTSDWVQAPQIWFPSPPEEVNLRQWETHKYLRTPCKEKIEWTREAAWFIGVYTAEGCVSKNPNRSSYGALQIVFGDHEADLIDRTEKALQNVFGVETYLQRNPLGEKVVRVCAFNARLCSFLYHVVGGEGKTKRVPFELLGGEMTGAYLDGLFHGDGHRGFHHDTPQWFFTTSYEEIRDGVTHLLLSLGVMPSVHEHHHTPSEINGRAIVATRPSYGIRVYGGNVRILENHFLGGADDEDREPRVQPRSRFVTDGDSFWLKVRGVERGSPNTTVVGIEVTGDHTYVVGHLATHNCTSPTLARDKLDMEEGVFLRALEHVKYCVRHHGQAELNLAGIGESTIHPRFVEFVGLARKAVDDAASYIGVSANTIRLLIATNGVALTEEIVKATKPYNLRYYVSMHRPEKAGPAIELCRKYDCLDGASADPSLAAIDWAGQVKWHVSAAPDRPCQWQREAMAFVMADGRVSSCCLDASGAGVIGHVNDNIGTFKQKPYSLCKTCDQVVGIKGYKQHDTPALVQIGN